MISPMRSALFALALFLSLAVFSNEPADTLLFKGQASVWAVYNESFESVMLGGRYIPQLNYERRYPSGSMFDLELSANAFTSWQTEMDLEGRVKPYRAWARVSAQQFELRLGLQKINFGSATIIRPLMWFDQMDTRDPLKLTDGVWGIMGRYYFLNNANVWFWALYGDDKLKGWELMPSSNSQPEFGGRVQYPLPSGEMAVSFHNRLVEVSKFGFPFQNFKDASESRWGLDAKFNWAIGFWVEASWTHSSANLDYLTNQTLVNVGADYTFGIGSGLYAATELLFASFDKGSIDFYNTASFALLSLSYPVTLFDNAGVMAYYNVDTGDLFSFFNWQRQYNRFSFHLMAYWNPDSADIINQNQSYSLFGGKGVQLMVVFNH